MNCFILWISLYLNIWTSFLPFSVWRVCVMKRFAGLMSVNCQMGHNRSEKSEKDTQTNTNIPTGWEQGSLGSKNGSEGRLMAAVGETGLEVGAFMHNRPWEAPFSPVAGPFTGSSSPALKRTPHASPLPCLSSFLSHHSPTAVSGWRCVIMWTHLRPPACEELGFVCGSLLTFGFKYVACKLFDGLAVDKCWLS